VKLGNCHIVWSTLITHEHDFFIVSLHMISDL